MREALFLSLLGGLIVACNGGAVLGTGTIFLLFLAVGWGRTVGWTLKLALTVDLQLLVGAIVIAYMLALPPYLAKVSILIPAAISLIGLIGYVVGPKPKVSHTNIAALALTLIAIAGFSLIWSLDSSARYEFIAQDKLRLWLDIFVHAGTIAEFGDPRTVDRGLSGLVDAAPPFYHFVSYAIPGLAVRLFGTSPADVITALWMPLGIFMTSLSIFSLGKALSGPIGGALAILLFSLVPDAASYGLKQGFFSFHWMMETSPGTLYALPAALSAITALVIWTRQRELSQLALALILLSSTFLLRAHIFIWLVVPFAVVIVLGLPTAQRKYRLLLLALGTIALPLVLLWIDRTEIATLGYHVFILRFIESVHFGMAPTAYDGFYLYLEQKIGAVASLPIGLILALVGMSGLWLLTFVVGFVLAARNRKLELIDALPLAALPYACAMMTLAPTPFSGDYSEFRHRAFVLIFILMLIWTARFIVILQRNLLQPFPTAFAACISLLSTHAWMPHAKTSRIEWAKAYDNIDMTPGIVEAARWIGHEGRRGDSIAFANTPPNEKLFDVPTVLMGISGVPAYLSRVGLFGLSGPPRSDISSARLAELAAIHSLTSIRGAETRLGQDGIGFYVASKYEMPIWDPNGANASFKAGDLVIWKAKTLINAPAR